MSEEVDQPSEHVVEVEPAKVDSTVEGEAPAARPGDAPTLGTKLFVIFFMIIVPPLGFAILVAVCWTLFKLVMAA